MLRQVYSTVVVCGRRHLAMATEFRPVVLSGPSGSGKSTLLKRLMGEFSDCFAFSVSHTTRKPRPGEEHGREYFFVKREDMEEMVKKGDFIETAEFSGNMYGTSKKSVEDVVKTGKICMLDIDMQGVKNIKQTTLNPRYIFIKPPSMQILEDRLKGRGTESAASLAKRLDIAKGELEYAEEKDSYDHTIVNDDLDTAYEKLKEILIKDIDQMMKNSH